MGISVISILYFSYNIYSYRVDLIKFKKELLNEVDGDDKELKKMIGTLEDNYSNRSNYKFAVKYDPTNLSRALSIDGLQNFYLGGSGKINVEFIWEKDNITKAAIQYNNKIYFLTLGDTLAGGKIIELSSTKLIFKKDDEISEFTVLSRQN